MQREVLIELKWETSPRGKPWRNNSLLVLRRQAKGPSHVSSYRGTVPCLSSVDWLWDQATWAAMKEQLSACPSYLDHRGKPVIKSYWWTVPFPSSIDGLRNQANACQQLWRNNVLFVLRRQAIGQATRSHGGKIPCSSSIDRLWGSAEQFPRSPLERTCSQSMWEVATVKQSPACSQATCGVISQWIFPAYSP